MDLRAERTRTLLFQAFSELMQKHDFDSISVSELCEKAMIRRATFYRHFKNKDDFFSAYVAKVREKISVQASFGTDSNLDIAAYCQRMTELFANLIEANEATMRKQQIGGSFDKLLGIAINQIANDLALHIAKTQGTEVDTGLASFYIGGLFGLARHHLTSEAPFDRMRFLAEHRRITNALFS